jgi:hypothetical protein
MLHFKVAVILIPSFPALAGIPFLIDSRWAIEEWKVGWCFITLSLSFKYGEDGLGGNNKLAAS